MNKRGLIKFLFVLGLTIMYIYFFIFTSDFDNYKLPIIAGFIVALTIFMYYFQKKIKEMKFAYNVLLLLITLLSMAYIGLIAYSLISSLFLENCSRDYQFIVIIFYPILIFLLFLFSITDVFRKTDKTNDILTIITCLTVIFIHLRFCFNSDAILLLYPNESHFLSEPFLQNYVYFMIMYTILLVHYIVNRKI